MNRNKKIFFWAFLFFSFIFALPQKVFSQSIRCYVTNDIKVCHNQADESVYYNTPSEQVAYNVQIIRDNLKYYTIYHSEPRSRPGSTGDSIKTGISNSPYNYVMPSNPAFSIWGTQNDGQSLLYTGAGVSGGGNPMTVAGKYWEGNPYFYVFFLGVSDDDRNGSGNDFRHYLLEGRTFDFLNYDIKTDNPGLEGWRPFNTNSCQSDPSSCRPMSLRDANNQLINSNMATTNMATQGLIGSISQVNHIYYFFYTDYTPDSTQSNKKFRLYYRSSPDVHVAQWSSPVEVAVIPDMTMIKVSKAKNMDRWVVMYGCYNEMNAQDQCIQYTRNLNVIGSGGISSLDFSSKGIYNLGLKGSGYQYDCFAQQDRITNKDGNLISPDTDDSVSRGGEITWSSCVVYNAAGIPDTWIYGKKVYRAGWDIQILPSPTPTPIPCNTVPVNCGGWGSCSASCGEGSQTRTCYDAGCGSAITQSQACNTQACCTGVYGNCTGWSPLCGTQTQTCYDTGCSTAQTQSQNGPACCSGSYGNCTEWSSCSLSCGGGTQSRTCYDTGCGTSQPQSQSCNTQACPTNTPLPSPTPLPISGDINHDYKVDIYDYNILIPDFGKTGSAGFTPSDIDNNGKVDIFDYNLLVGNFGSPRVEADSPR